MELSEAGAIGKAPVARIALEFELHGIEHPSDPARVAENHDVDARRTDTNLGLAGEAEKSENASKESHAVGRGGFYTRQASLAFRILSQASRTAP